MLVVWVCELVCMGFFCLFAFGRTRLFVVVCVTAGQVIDPHLMNRLRRNLLLTILLIRGLVMSRDV